MFKVTTHKHQGSKLESSMTQISFIVFANKTRAYPSTPLEPAQDDFHIRPERVAFKFKLLCAHEMSDQREREDNLQLSVQLGNLDLK